MAVAYKATVLGTALVSSATAVVNLSSQAAGDLAVVFISRQSTVAPTDVPTDWTLLSSTLVTYGSWVYYKTLVSGDLANTTWTWAATSKTLAHAVLLTGHDTTTPFPTGWNKSSATAALSNMTLGSVTTTIPFILYLTSKYDTAARFTQTPSGFTERLDSGSTAPDFWHSIGTRDDWVSGTSNPTVSIYSDSAQTTSATATYRFGWQIPIAAAPTGTAYTQSVSVAAAIVPITRRSTKKVLRNTAAAVASTSRIGSFFRSFRSTSASTARMSRVATFRRTVSVAAQAVASAIANKATTIQYVLVSVSSMVQASATRRTLKVFRTSSSVAAGVSRMTRKTARVVSGGLARVSRRTAKRVTLTASALARSSKAATFRRTVGATAQAVARAIATKLGAIASFRNGYIDIEIPQTYFDTWDGMGWMPVRLYGRRNSPARLFFWLEWDSYYGDTGLFLEINEVDTGGTSSQLGGSWYQPLSEGRFFRLQAIDDLTKLFQSTDGVNWTERISAEGYAVADLAGEWGCTESDFVVRTVDEDSLLRVMVTIKTVVVARISKRTSKSFRSVTSSTARVAKRIFKAVRVASSAVVRVSRRTLRTVRAASNAAVRVSRRARRSFRAASATAVSVRRATKKSAMRAAASVIVRSRKLSYKVVRATASIVTRLANLTRMMYMTVRVVTQGNASVRRMARLNRRVTAEGKARMSKAALFVRSFRASASVVAVVMRGFSLPAFRATASVMVGVSTKILEWKNRVAGSAAWSRGASALNDWAGKVSSHPTVSKSVSTITEWRSKASDNPVWKRRK